MNEKVITEKVEKLKRLSFIANDDTEKPISLREMNTYDKGRENSPVKKQRISGEKETSNKVKNIDSTDRYRDMVTMVAPHKPNAITSNVKPRMSREKNLKRIKTTYKRGFKKDEGI